MIARPPGDRRTAGSLACLLAAALPQLLSPARATDPLTDYRLDCMGCHLADGSGAPGKVPDMRRSLAILSSTPAGRRYLVEVPGSAQAPLSNGRLARLLDWMVRHLSATPVPRHFVRFTAAEIALYRRAPLIQVNETRRRLLAGVVRGMSPPVASPGEPSPGAKVAAQVENASGLEAAPVEEEHPEDRTLWDELNGPNIPKWGTPEARMREMLRLQRRIDELRRRKKEE